MTYSTGFSNFSSGFDDFNLPRFPQGNFINNQWVRSSKNELPSYDPSTGRSFFGYFPGDVEQIDQAVTGARIALSDWKEKSPVDRGRFLTRWSQEVLNHLEDLAVGEMLDSGKPISFARNCVKMAARYLEYYGGVADKIQGETIPLGKDYLDFTLKEPLGVTGHILPWNVPLGMMVRSVAPALAAGCTAVVKPAEQTPLGALQLAELAFKAGLPPGVIQVVNGGAEIGRALVSHQGVDGITFTGSVETGIQVSTLAAKDVKSVVLELGGKSPIIACSGSDPQQVANEVSKGIYSNSGQYCDASSRLLVHRSLKEAVVEAVIEVSKQVLVGPATQDLNMGPLISHEQKSKVLNYIAIGKKEAELVFAGECFTDSFSRGGYFVSPTVFTEVKPNHVIAQDEIFGPVLSILEFDEIEEAVEIANQTQYGLSAGVFSPNINIALWVSRQLLSGTVYINEYYCGDVSLPFGGFKKSGIGRECGLETISNYTQTKNIIVRVKSPNE